AAAPPSLHSFPTRRSSDLHLLEDRAGGLELLVPAGVNGRQRTGVAVAANANQGVGLLVKLDQRRRGVGDLLQAAFFQQHFVQSRSEEHTSELQSRENLVCR